MSSQVDGLQPPRVPVWLVTLFSPAVHGESILGDLSEEFSRLASTKGIVHARRWYWRQTVTTIPHLLATGFRSAPWTITALVTGAFLLRWFISSVSDPAVSRSLDAVLTKYRVYEHDPQAYVFWLTSSMLTVRLVVNAFFGALVAVAAKGREMAATIALGFLGVALAIQSTWLTVARTGDHGVLWTLPHTVAFSMSIVAAGAAVRTYRALARTRQPV